MRKIFVMSCILALILVSVGCGGEQAERDSSPAEISMMLALYSNEVPSDLLRLALEEKTGTSLTLNWIPDPIYSDKLRSALTTGTLPMVIQVKVVDLQKPAVVGAIRSGMFWEIGPYLNEYPNIHQFMNPMIMDSGAYYGKYYGLYWELPMSRQGIQFRKDWLVKLGLQEPKSLDELYQVLKAFTIHDPDGNGKHDTYGLIDRNDLVYGAFKNIATYFGAPNHWGWVNGRLTPDFMTIEYRNAMKFMKRLYEEGIINPDFTITSKTQQEDRFASGEAGMMISNLLVLSSNNRVKKQDPHAEVDILNRIKGPLGERTWGGTGLGGLYLFPKTSVKTETELRQILQFFDQLLSEEVNNLITYGIEGRHYVRTEDGAAKVTPDTRDLRKQEVEAYNTAFRTSDIRYLTQGSMGELQKKIYRLIEDNRQIVVHDPTSGLLSPTRAERGEALSRIITEATYDFILGVMNEEGYERALEEWRANGGDRIIEEINQAYQEKMK
ncbi:extracellular solute-binding protein [Ammoniphilus sp. YIM 78166]|uniref:extracellular solute-binding protein n=1 Tax=Ammoniphilus sp. YIM 78166 TaxID=1644106 RepID=UPI0014307F2F|nr:extracellular solute-binding protein [Ammoniphilus sp. YIM 78166]